MSSWWFIELVSSCYSWRCRAVFKLYYLVVAASQAYDSPHLVLRTRQPFLQSTMLVLFFVIFWDKAMSWFASSAPWFMQVWLSSPSLYLWTGQEATSNKSPLLDMPWESHRLLKPGFFSVFCISLLKIQKRSLFVLIPDVKLVDINSGSKTARSIFHDITWLHFPSPSILLLSTFPILLSFSFLHSLLFLHC